MERRFHITPLRRLYVLFSVLFLATSFAFLSGSVHAAAAGCRTDPIVKLIGGKSLKLTVVAGTSAKNISLIEYTVHLPAGSQVKKIVYTGGKFKNKETVTVLYDAAPNTYALETIVHASKTAATTVKMALRSRKTSANGLTDELLSLTLNP